MGNRKPIIINPRLLRPLPQTMWGIACSLCGKLQSKWEMGVPQEERAPELDATFVCSVCFLYDSTWATTWSPELASHLEAVEQERGQKFVRDPNGRLFNKDADDVVAKLALTSRMFQLRDRLQRFGMRE